MVSVLLMKCVVCEECVKYMLIYEMKVLFERYV